MKRSRFVVLLVVGAFVLAACGGGDDDGRRDREPPAATAESIAGPLDAAECAQVVTAMAAAAAAVPQVMSGEAGDLGTSVDQLEAWRRQGAGGDPRRPAARRQGYATYSRRSRTPGYDPASGAGTARPRSSPRSPRRARTLQDADFQAASERVSAWFAENCGS